MKNLLKSWMMMVVAAGMVMIANRNARADLEISASVRIHAVADFYTPLTPIGAWIEVDNFGRCWHPSSVAVDWQPYTEGRWVWTDVGWYWESDEPWSWATYHYGRWVHHRRHGWVWIPEVEWGPAWVTWRVGGGYVGWAPLEPHVRVAASVPAAPFVFVETARFQEPQRRSTVIVNNTTIVNKTTVVNNNVTHETRTIGDLGPRKVVINQGPPVAEIERVSGRKLRSTPIQEVVQRTSAPASQPRAMQQQPQQPNNGQQFSPTGRPAEQQNPRTIRPERAVTNTPTPPMERRDNLQPQPQPQPRNNQQPNNGQRFSPTGRPTDQNPRTVRPERAVTNTPAPPSERRDNVTPQIRNNQPVVPRTETPTPPPAVRPNVPPVRPPDSVPPVRPVTPTPRRDNPAPGYRGEPSTPAPPSRSDRTNERPSTVRPATPDSVPPGQSRRMERGPERERPSNPTPPPQQREDRGRGNDKKDDKDR